MFGSLVIVFPTPHEGGALRVSHNWSKSTTIDFTDILKNTPASSIEFAAFYSNVDHEVSSVTSGYRVSLTYNLYYVDGDEIEDNLNEIVYAQTNSSYEDTYSKLRVSISNWLQDPIFLSEGGVLGFRLGHDYTIPEEATTYHDSVYYLSRKNHEPLGPLKKFLKGSDAVIYNVCTSLGLIAALRFVYHGSVRYIDKECALGTHFLSNYGLRSLNEDNNFIVPKEAVWEFVEKNYVKIDDYDFTWLRGEWDSEELTRSYLHIVDENEGASQVALVVFVGPPNKREEGFKDLSARMGFFFLNGELRRCSTWLRA